MADAHPPKKSNVRKPSEWMREKPLGKALREKYQDVKEEEVPQRLLDTINRIRQAEKAKKQS